MASHREKREFGLLAVLALLVVGLLVGLGFMLFWGDNGRVIADRDGKPVDAGLRPVEKSGSGERKPAVGDRGPEVVEPTPKEETAAKPTTGATNEPEYVMVVEGTTPFQRRLSFGTALLKARDDLQGGRASAPRVAEAIFKNIDHFLVLDSFTVDQAQGKAWGTGNLVNEVRGNIEVIANSKSASPSIKATLLQILEPFVGPRRDREAFRMTVSSATDDPMAAEAPVRVWTIGEAFPAEALATAQATMLRLKKIVGVEPTPSIDILATPTLGAETFGVLSASSRASGLYLIPDKFCVVRSTLSTDWLPEVLEHEMVHAITFPLGRSSAAPFESSRFVSEGLAEYLRKHEEDDRSLDLPTTRFRDECALLYQYVVSKELEGWDFSGLKIDAFVDLKPDAFYGYGAFAYLVAQASMAAMPKGEILRALKDDKNDLRLVAHVKKMGWNGLLKFVEKTMVGGDHRRAKVMDDGVLDQGALDREFGRLIGRKTKTLAGDYPIRYGVKSSESLPGMLRDIGISSKRADGEATDSMNSPTQFFTPVTDRTQSETEALLEILTALRAAERIEIHSEVDRTLLENFELARVTSKWLADMNPNELDGRTRRVFLEGFVEELRRVRKDSGTKSPWFEASAGVHSALAVRPFAPRDLAFSMASVTARYTELEFKQAHLVILTGGKDAVLRGRAPTDIQNYLTPQQKDQWRKMTAEQREPVIETALPLILADQILLSGLIPLSVLVVDLSNGQGDAKVIHDAFAHIMPTGSRLVLWNPQRELAQVVGTR